MRFSMLAAAGIAAASSIASATATEIRDATPDDIVGAWELVSFSVQTGDKTTMPFGEHPKGVLIQTHQDMLFTIIAENRQPPASAAMTDEEAARLMRSMTMWGARYTCDPNPAPDGLQCTYHLTVSSNQGLTGSDRVFFVKTDGDTLFVTSKSQPSVVDGAISISRPVWRRLSK